jgi:hypothetical protein
MEDPDFGLSADVDAVYRMRPIRETLSVVHEKAKGFHGRVEARVEQYG